MADKKIRLTESEIDDMLYAINVRDSARKACLNEEIVKPNDRNIIKEYYLGVADAYIEANMLFYDTRDKIAKKYGVSRDFAYSNGILSVREDGEYEGNE